MTDCDFPLIKQFQRKNIDVVYLIEIVTNHLRGGLFNIKSVIPSHGIVKAAEVPEFRVYSDYLDLSRTYLIIRSNKFYDKNNWITYVKLVKKIKNFSPDVIHTSCELGIAQSLLYLFRKKMVLTVHDPFPHSGEFSKSSEIKRSLIFKMARKLILLNKSQKKDFEKHYKISNGKVSLNQLGAYECLNFISNGFVEAKKKQRYILFFGHISPYKGVDVLCEAMTIVHQTIPDLNCVIAGRGSYNFDVSFYEKLSYIQFINSFVELKDLAQLIKNALFSVCPYKDATQSGVVSSSFAMAKPVLATNVGGLAESVVDGESGFLVPPNNADALAKAIVKMTTSYDVLNEMSKKIERKYMSGEKSWPEIADRYIECYENIDKYNR